MTTTLTPEQERKLTAGILHLKSENARLKEELAQAHQGLEDRTRIIERLQAERAHAGDTLAALALRFGVTPAEHAPAPEPPAPAEKDVHPGPRRREKPCSVEWCQKGICAHSLCWTHLRRLNIHGDWALVMGRGQDGLQLGVLYRETGAGQYEPADPSAPVPDRRTGEGTRCSVEWCGKRVLASGLCSSHHNRYRKYGDPYLLTGTGRNGLRYQVRYREVGVLAYEPVDGGERVVLNGLTSSPTCPPTPPSVPEPTPEPKPEAVKRVRQQPAVSRCGVESCPKRCLSASARFCLVHAARARLHGNPRLTERDGQLYFEQQDGSFILYEPEYPFQPKGEQPHE